MTLFDDAAAVQPIDEDRFLARAHEGFGNVVGPFGGITAATVLNTVLSHPEVHGEPVALTVNFAAPISDGEWELMAVPMRTNRSSQHWTMHGEQDQEIVVTATAITAVPRKRWGAQDVLMPEAPAPEACEVTPTVFPLRWLQQYRMRFIEGALPAPADQADSRSVFWLERTETAAWDHARIAAAADAIFPRVMLRTGPETIFGTVSMTTYFHASAAELAAAGEHLLIEAVAGRYANGHYDQRANLFSTAGVLLATTTQIVYYKA